MGRDVIIAFIKGMFINVMDCNIKVFAEMSHTIKIVHLFNRSTIIFRLISAFS